MDESDLREEELHERWQKRQEDEAARIVGLQIAKQIAEGILEKIIAVARYDPARRGYFISELDAARAGIDGVLFRARSEGRK